MSLQVLDIFSSEKLDLWSLNLSSVLILPGLTATILYTDILCKQFEPRSGPTKSWPDLDPNCLTL